MRQQALPLQVSRLPFLSLPTCSFHLSLSHLPPFLPPPHSLSPQSSNKVKPSELDEFRRLYLAAHYVALAAMSKGSGLKDLAAMQLTAVLR